MNATSIKRFAPVLWLAGGLLLGWLIFAESPSASTETADAHAHGAETAFTCSMHPQIRQNGPGKCPLCGMDLTPVSGDEAGNFEIDAVSLSEDAMALAGIQTQKLTVTSPVISVKVNGTITEDESRQTVITARFAGRIEKLHINISGQTIEAGQLLAEVYSPELIAAQRELIEMLTQREANKSLYMAARRKLESWNIPDNQITKIEKSGRPLEYFPVLAPSGGTVTELLVRAGENLETGMMLMKIADLKTVWAQFDIFEQDIPLVAKGDSVLFYSSSFPGKTTRGRIDFVEPSVNEATRTLKARTTVQAGNMWKPGMIVQGTIFSSLRKGIEIPASALLWAGTSSYVWIKRPDTDPPVFEIREVRTGLRTEIGWIVERGLTGNEEIAVQGVFRLDAAAQLSGKVSMLNRPVSPVVPENPGTEKSLMDAILGGNHNLEKVRNLSDIERNALSGFLSNYVAMVGALVENDPKTSMKKARDAAKMVESFPFEQEYAKEERTHIHGALLTLSKTPDLLQQRKNLNLLSIAVYDLLKKSGYHDQNLFLQYCPMARNNVGGFWISRSEEIQNPYFGAEMLSCGETILRFNP